MSEWRRTATAIEMYDADADTWVRVTDDFGVDAVRVDTLTGLHTVNLYVRSSTSGYNAQPCKRSLLKKRAVMSELYDLGLRLLDDDDFTKFAQQVLFDTEENLEAEFIHDKLGFVKVNGKEVFFLDSPVGLSDPLKASSHYCTDALVPRGTLQSYLDGLQQYVIGHAPLELALAIGALAPVSHLLREARVVMDIPLVALIGQSSSSKTTSLRLAASEWGLPMESIGLIDSLHQTENALYATLERSIGVPTFIDECSARPQWNFSDMVYLISQGRSKKRCNASGKLRHTAQFSGAVIFTGERSLLERTQKNAGLYARILELTFDYWTEDSTHAEDLYTFVCQNYGTVAPVLVDWLMQNRDLLPQMFADERAKISKLTPPTSGVEIRLIKIAAQILVAAQALNASLGITLNLDSMRLILAGQIDLIRPKVDKSAEAYQTLLQLISEHASHFVREKKRDNEHRVPGVDTYGTFGYYHSTACVWIPSDRFETWLTRANVFSPNEITRDWASKGWLVDYGQRHYLRDHAINGMELACYCLLLPDSPSVFNRLNALSSSATADDISMALDGCAPRFSVQTAETQELLQEASTKVETMMFALIEPCYQRQAVLLNQPLVKALGICEECYLTIIPNKPFILLTAVPAYSTSIRAALTPHENGKLCKNRALRAALAKHGDIKLNRGEGIVFTDIQIDKLREKYPAACICVDQKSLGTYRNSMDSFGWNFPDEPARLKEEPSNLDLLLAEENDNEDD